MNDPQPKNKSILIIENDDGMMRVVQTRLEQQGYQCVTATTGMKGFSLFSAGEFDLVITDLNMPNLDGIGLCEKIRKQSKVPIIVMTGFRGSYIAGLSHLDNLTILDKPFDSQSLIDLVRSEISTKHRRAG